MKFTIEVSIKRKRAYGMPSIESATVEGSNSYEAYQAAKKWKQDHFDGHYSKSLYEFVAR